MAEAEHQRKPKPTTTAARSKGVNAPRPKPPEAAACPAPAPVFALEAPRALLTGDGDVITLTLVNTSDEPQTIEHFDVSSPSFVVELQPGISIAGGGALGVRVVFRPTSVRPLHAATLRIAPASGAPPASIRLHGLGVGAAAPSAAPPPRAAALRDWSGAPIPYGPAPRPTPSASDRTNERAAQPTPADAEPVRSSEPRRLAVIDPTSIRLTSVAGQPAMAARVDVINQGRDVAVLKARVTNPAFQVTGGDQFVAPVQRNPAPVSVHVHYVPRVPGEHAGELILVDKELGHEILIELHGRAHDPSGERGENAAERAGIYGVRARRSGLAAKATRPAEDVAMLGGIPAQIQRELPAWDARAAQYSAQIRQGAAQLNALLIAWVRDEGLTAVREHEVGGRQSAGSDMIQFVALKAAEAGLASGGHPAAALALVAADLAWSLYDAYSSNADNTAQARAGATRIRHAASFATRGAADATDLFMQVHENAVSSYKVARQELVMFARTDVQAALMARTVVSSPAAGGATIPPHETTQKFDARRASAEWALRVLEARARATPQVVHATYTRLLDEYTAFRATGSIESAPHERQARGTGWINFDTPLSVGYQLTYGRFRNPSPTVAMHLGARQPQHIRGWNVVIELRSVQGGSIELRQSPDGRRSQTVTGEAVEAVARAGGIDRVWEVVDRRDRRLR